MEKTITQMQAIRDLEWVMKSPSLLAGDTEGLVQDLECGRWFEQASGALAELSGDAGRLLQFLEAHDRSGRLGNRFESLILFWLKDLLGMDPVHWGVPIREDGHTVGELDFLLGTPTGWEHWEVAVKFYMCIATSPRAVSDPSSFVGQALLDRLDLKRTHLLEKQLPLGRDPRALNALARLRAASPVRSRLLMKGRLFYPLEWDWRRILGPVCVSSNHERGWWIAWDAVGKERLRALPLESGALGWSLHPKAGWMAPQSLPVFSTQDALFRALDDHFSDPMAPALSITGHGVGMVLKPGWPRSALKGEAASKTGHPS